MIIIFRIIKMVIIKLITSLVSWLVSWLVKVKINKIETKKIITLLYCLRHTPHLLGTFSNTTLFFNPHQKR